MDERRIGDLLVDAGIIARDTLERVFAQTPRLGERRILSELYARGFVRERPLAEVLAKRVGAPVAVLTESTIDLEVVKLVPAAVMREHLILPVHADERSITVVTPDPDAPGLLVPLGFATGRRVVPLIGIHAILEHVIEDALLAIHEGRLALPGESAISQTPMLVVARDLPPIGLEEANALAKQIVEALSDLPRPEPTRKEIGAVRLKQLMVDRSKLPAASQAAAAALTTQAQDSAPTSVAAKQPVALVVDDDDAIRQLLMRALRHDGIHVVEAKTGEEAVTLLRVMRPDIVVLDAMLPVIHGFEICASLKRSQLKDIPVVMISAIYRGWEQARDIQERHGADHFVQKPFEVTFVRRLVADVLGRTATITPPVDGTCARIDGLRQQLHKHLHENDLAAADEVIGSWIDLDPFDGRAWLERGNLAARGRDLVGAMAAYEAAVVYDPALLGGHLGLAMVYEQLGFRRRAKATWLRAWELAPDDKLRAQIQTRLG